MPKLHIVLDTNCFRGMSRTHLEQISDLGLAVRISEVALGEMWARSVREFQEGRRARSDARRLLSGRIRSVLPYLDRSPLAFVGSMGRAMLRADIEGGTLDELGGHEERCRRFLQRAARPELTDEEWLSGGTDDFGPFLTEADREWQDFNLPELALWEQRYTDDEERDNHRSLWAAMSVREKADGLVHHLVTSLDLEGEELTRSDLMIRMMAWRMLNNTHPYGRARENDGADNMLTMHVSNGGILLTQDRALLGAVEACGTFHSAWVRHPLEALEQPLPRCFPWDAGAAAVHASFRRTSIDLGLIEAVRWPPA